METLTKASSTSVRSQGVRRTRAALSSRFEGKTNDSTATKHALHAFSASMMRELIETPIRVSEIQPGMVETGFSVTRFRGDEAAAKNVYQGLDPLTAHDVAEEVVWIASRPPHVKVAEMLLLPTAQGGSTLSHRK